MDFNTLLAVRDLMTRNIVTVPAAASVGDAARLMAEKGISSVILTADDGTIAGIITESDIVRKIVAAGIDCRTATAGSVASGEVHRIEGSTSIFDARSKMTELKVKHLIVEDDGKPVGLISSTALLGS